MEDGIHMDRDRCTGCGLCAEACPAAALERLGGIVGSGCIGGRSDQGPDLFREIGRGRDPGRGEKTDPAGPLCRGISEKAKGGRDSHGPGHLRHVFPTKPWKRCCPIRICSFSTSRRSTRRNTGNSPAQPIKGSLKTSPMWAPGCNPMTRQAKSGSEPPSSPMPPIPLKTSGDREIDRRNPGRRGQPVGAECL